MLFKRLICCACSSYKQVSIEKVQNLVNRARASGIEVNLVPDMCLEVVKFPENFASYANSETTVIALCRLRTAKAFFEKLSLPVPEIIGLNDDCADEKIARLGWNSSEHEEPVVLPEYQSDWISWFPLIDKNRCNNCGKCIDFCLFGVYARHKQQVVVTKPEECKTNCPACSRMCPQRAIIFPKHNEEPFNGAPVADDNAVPEKTDSSEEDDLYEKLARRRQKQAARKLLKDD